MNAGPIDQEHPCENEVRKVRHAPGNRPNQAVYAQIGQREEKTAHVLECRLANRIVKAEALRDRLEFLSFRLDEDLHDLHLACRWADRIALCQKRLADETEEIGRLWLELWRGVAAALLKGDPVTKLDRFFFWALPYLEPVLRGEVTYAELDAGYDWAAERFRLEFAARMRALCKQKG